MARLDGTHLGVRIHRDSRGVPHLHARDDVELARGLGYAHGVDRPVQMDFLRLVAQGRLSEALQDTDETVAIDRLMRNLGLARLAERDIADLDADTRATVEAYCEGVNASMGSPLMLRLVGRRPEPWTPADTLATVTAMSWIGLASSQQDMEKLLVQALAGGVDPARLRELLSPHLDGLDDELVALLPQVRVEQGLLPEAVRFLVPRLMASNTWALAASRSATGHALFACDPHLEINRLPGLWYEFVGHTADDFRMGISMPGVPGLVMGRTRRVAAGFSYGFMDLVDYFVEEVRDEAVRRGGAWVPLDKRRERLARKGGVEEVAVYTSSHGTLETRGQAPLPDGLYLARAWAGERFGSAASLRALQRWVTAADVVQASEVLREITISCNWTLADADGRVAYQQSGALPDRVHSGLHPVAGWREDLAWRGQVDPARLVHLVDPDDGLIITANDGWNRAGHPLAVNLPMGDYRARRIRQVLESRDQHNPEQLRKLQLDLHSIQAGEILAVLEPLLPEGPAADALRAWDHRYDTSSVGAAVFEDAYAAVLRAVFGQGLLGEEAWDSMVHTTGVLADYYHFFDQILLGGGEGWFTDELLRDTLAAALAGHDLRPLGERRRFVMRHILLGGKLPRFLGVDRGPYELAGGRATVTQGALFHSAGRLTSFAPSWRFVTDLSTREAATALAGGPAEQPWSRWYTTDIQRWLEGSSKSLVAEP